MLLRVSVFAIAVLAVEEKSDSSRRLQKEQLLRRRRNFWRDDIGDMFISVGEWVVDEVWEPVDDWFKDDFANAMEDIWHFASHDMWESETWEDFGEVTADTFVKTWDTIVDELHLDDALDWLEGAGGSIEDFFVKFGCSVDWHFGGDKCTQCIKDSCNSVLNPEYSVQWTKALSVALMDMDEEFEPLFDTCADTMMESCPSIADCQELSALPASTQAFVADTIARCNLCYQCLPYGSTNEGCQKALDDIMPNNCEGCSVNKQNMYKLFYSCCSIESIVSDIGRLGDSYADGGDARENLDSICEYCENCSGYKTELKKTCTDWDNIKKNWDMKAPVVPDVLCLNEEGCPAPEVDDNVVAPSSEEPVATPEPMQDLIPSPTPKPTRGPTSSPTKPGYVDPEGRPSSGGSVYPNGPHPYPTGGRPAGRPGRGRRLRL